MLMHTNIIQYLIIGLNIGFNVLINKTYCNKYIATHRCLHMKNT